MNGKRLHFVAGVLLGAALFGGGTVLAAGLTAEPSRQAIYVDGKQTQMQAYSIGGSNYVKLRDVGKAVDFGVTYDAATNSVRIDSDSPYVEEVKTATATNADGSINIPQGDAMLMLKEGDVVRCDDGTNYTIKDMSRYDASAFAEGPLPPLPTATCDWSSFPVVELPKAEVRRFNDPDGDYMFIRNLYESRRMQYTIMNLAGNHPDTSIDGKLRYGSKGTPYVLIQLSIEDDTDAQPFWPWRESQLSDDFNAAPVGAYDMEAWDVYRNGIFLYTQYSVLRHLL